MLSHTAGCYCNGKLCLLFFCLNRDEQRIRDLKKMLNSKGFELSPVDYLKKMRLPSLRDLQTLDDSR